MIKVEVVLPALPSAWFKTKEKSWVRVCYNGKRKRQQQRMRLFRGIVSCK